MLGPPELMLIAGLAVLLFGASRLPKIARSIGRSKGELEKGLNESQQTEPVTIESD